MKIACLHTLPTSIGLFEEALAAGDRAGVALSHEVRTDLLAQAEAAGGLTPEVVAGTRAALLALTADADVVLLTCSTLGPGIEGMTGAVPVLRVDSALARQATANGGKVVVLYAAETTREPTRALFEAEAAGAGAQIELRMVKDAWPTFRRGEFEAYHRLIAADADRAMRDGADVVALAQASMAGASNYTRIARPLSSPSAGMAAAIAALRGA